RSVSAELPRRGRGGRSEPPGNKLGVRCGVALAGRLRADQQCYPAVGIKIQRRGFRAVVAAGLDIGRNADASQTTGASGLRRAFVEALPISKLLGTRER